MCASFFLHKSYFHTAGRIIVSMELIDNHSRSGLCFSPLNNFFFCKKKEGKIQWYKRMKSMQKNYPLLWVGQTGEALDWAAQLPFEGKGSSAMRNQWPKWSDECHALEATKCTNPEAVIITTGGVVFILRVFPGGWMDVDICRSVDTHYLDRM